MAAMTTASIVFLSYRDRGWIDAALDAVLAQSVPCQLLISKDPLNKPPLIGDTIRI